VVYVKKNLQDFYRTMVRIRLFEEKIGELFLAGEVPVFANIKVSQTITRK